MMRTKGTQYRGKYPSKRQVNESIRINAPHIKIESPGYFPYPNVKYISQPEHVLFVLAVGGIARDTEPVCMQAIAASVLNKWNLYPEHYPTIRDILMEFDEEHGTHCFWCFDADDDNYKWINNPDFVTYLKTAREVLPLYFNMRSLGLKLITRFYRKNTMKYKVELTEHPILIVDPFIFYSGVN